MNGKKAKQLCRLAEKQTVGMDDRKIMISPRGTAINHPKTTRAMYRALKKQYKPVQR